ncbi:hypothetical protein [Ktedonobacter sp. SOSP1-52]|uniref:hypothetical protein n=1 Tax=Ktedonobacter sp. SOSP1-52 TaxID=2778366 RepID=UPI0019165991|nr:hypothetical protein [Ktedonobacter sp. SOSP1-52]
MQVATRSILLAEKGQNFLNLAHILGPAPALERSAGPPDRALPEAAHVCCLLTWTKGVKKILTIDRFSAQTVQFFQRSCASPPQARNGRLTNLKTYIKIKMSKLSILDE